MKFIVSRDVLYRNLSAISGVLSSNNSMPILDDFLFSIQGDKLTLTASDLDTTMQAEIALDNVDGEGAVAVPAKLLIETLKLIPETPIVFAIDVENNIMKFQAANGEYDAPCRPGDEYPQMKQIENPSAFDIDASVLQRAISKTLFATGTDELRPTMMGVFCQLDSEAITFVATDSHKLVRYRNTKVTSEEYTSFILPRKPLSNLKGILSGHEGDIHVEYSKETNHIRFSFDNIVLFSTLKEGKYPNYEGVIPKDNPNYLMVSREDFLKSIRRVGIYSDQATFQVRVSLSENGTNITAEDMNFSNKAAENITGEYVGQPMDIGFNTKFLREMLENIDTDQIRVEMSQPSKPALILPVLENENEEDLLMLIMPVMLGY